MTPDVHTLTGAYALDALTELERRQFERHLAECAECAREIDELRATAARLGSAVTAQPPDPLRQRVLDQITATRQDRPGERGPSVSGDRPQRWTLRLTAAVAAVAVAAAVTLGVVASRAQHQLDTAQGQLAQLRTENGSFSAVLGAPDVRVAAANGVTGGTAIVAVSHHLAQGVLLLSGLPRPSAGHDYQAWLLGAGPARSVGVLGHGLGTTGSSPLALRGLTAATKIGVTVEPAGGSTQPTTTPVMLFNLPV